MENPRPRPNRREFIELVGLGAAGAFVSGWAVAADDPAPAEKKGDPPIPRRRLGRTGLDVSVICIGGSPAPEERVFRAALEGGINFLDTSSSYQRGQSETVYGKYLREIRDQMVIMTKFHPSRARNADDLIAEAEGSLKRLGTDRVDLLAIHGVGPLEQATEEKVLTAFEKLKKAGKIRFAAVSCHNRVAQTIPGVIESGHYDAVMIGFNVYGSMRRGERNQEQHDDLFAVSGYDKVFALAKEKKVGVIAMKVQSGGNNQKLRKWLTPTTTAAQAKIKWALSRPEIASVCTEVRNVAEMAENLTAARTRVTEAQLYRLRSYCAENSSQVCRMCGECEEACPQGLHIPDMLRAGMYAFGYEKPESAVELYRSLPADRTFAACHECGRCEDACPYGVEIRSGMRAAHLVLS